MTSLQFEYEQDEDKVLVAFGWDTICSVDRKEFVELARKTLNQEVEIENPNFEACRGETDGWKRECSENNCEYYKECKKGEIIQVRLDEL